MNLAGQSELAAGTYRFRLSPAVPPILVTLPEGWSNFLNWATFGPGDTALSFWDVTQLYGHPCQSHGTLFDPGPTADDLADAITEIPLRNATAPIYATVDGYGGKYVEWSVPADADFAECDTGEYVSWKSKGWNSERYQQAPGQVDRLWILDVGGARLVIDAFYMPSSTHDDREQLQRVVESIRFED